MRRAVLLAAPILGVALLVVLGSIHWSLAAAWPFLLIAAIAALIWLQSGEQQGQAEEG